MEKESGYKVVSPLGKRPGVGTFDTVFNSNRYASLEDAVAANDVAIINFVEKDEILYFEAYVSRNPLDKQYLRLQIQEFPFGIDMIDDQHGYGLGSRMLEAYYLKDN